MADDNDYGYSPQNLLDLRPTTSHPLVTGYDPAQMDEDLGRASSTLTGIALPLALAALGGPAKISAGSMALPFLQSILSPFDRPRDDGLLTGTAAWKERGVPPELINMMRARNLQNASKLNLDINDRGTEFHATDPSLASKILDSGEIVHNAEELGYYGAKNSRELAQILASPKYNWYRRPVDPETANSIVDELLSVDSHGLGPEKQALLDRASRGGMEFYDALRANFDPAHVGSALWQRGMDVPLEFWNSPSSGVSTSRVPRVKSKGTKAVSFELDPSKMPPTRPYSEPGYDKTTESGKHFSTYYTPEEVTRLQDLQDEWWRADANRDYAKQRNIKSQMDALSAAAKERKLADRPMNPLFEFENRTYNQPIPISAAKRILIDTSALPTPVRELLDPALSKEALFGLRNARARELQQQLQSQSGNIPVELVPSGRAMHSIRVKNPAKSISRPLQYYGPSQYPKANKE